MLDYTETIILSILAGLIADCFIYAMYLSWQGWNQLFDYIHYLENKYEVKF